MGRYRPFSRRKHSKLLRGWLRRSAWRLVAAVFVVLLFVGVVTAWMLAVPPRTFGNGWLLGVLQVVLIATFLHLVHVVFLAHEREAINQVRGAWGEDFTRDELKRAKRKGYIWGWVDSIPLENGDIDHFVITKRGGLVAIDTKWRSDGGDVSRMAEAARNASRRAKGIAQNYLLGGKSRKHRLNLNSLTVCPLVVIWGPASSRVPANFRCDDVEFVKGRDLVSWLAEMDSEPVSKSVAVDLLDRLKEFRASSWDANVTKIETGYRAR